MVDSWNSTNFTDNLSFTMADCSTEKIAFGKHINSDQTHKICRWTKIFMHSSFTEVHVFMHSSCACFYSLGCCNVQLIRREDGNGILQFAWNMVTSDFISEPKRKMVGSGLTLRWTEVVVHLPAFTASPTPSIHWIGKAGWKGGGNVEGR